MGVRKNHHFVPQFYFRRFSSDGRSICVLRRDTGILVAQAPIKSQSSKKWFYGDDKFESALAEIEGYCHHALEELAQCDDPKTLSLERYALVLVWINLQRARTQAAREDTQAMIDKYTKVITEIAVNTDPKIAAIAAKLPNPLSDHVKADPVAFQQTTIKIAIEQTGALLDLVPVLLLNSTNRPFVFGDAPVALHNSYFGRVKHRGVLGLANAGFLAFLPLSPTLTFALIDGESYQIKRLFSNKIKIKDLSDIAALNKLQLHTASECLYFHSSEYNNYVKSLWDAEHSNLAPHVGKVVEGQLVLDEKGDGKQVLHNFSPQVPFGLQLSFLKHEVFGDDDQRPNFRRSYQNGYFDRHYRK
jgi:hypothetical protein